MASGPLENKRGLAFKKFGYRPSHRFLVGEKIEAVSYHLSPEPFGPLATVILG